MQPDRSILHVDCNAFYASVEEILHPELKKVPMAIAGDPKSRRGIILAKNQLAKGYGIKTAETVWQARQKCPELVLRPAKHSLYREYCERVNAIYEQYTDQVERFGIDESYLDITGSLFLFHSTPLELAHEIRKRVADETGLTVSVGVSFNKIFAKLGSDYKKPNAVTEITREGFRDIVWPLPVGALLMVGRTTQDALAKIGADTIGDLAKTNADLLQARLGKFGVQLRHYANGEDDSPVLHIGESEPLQSVGNGMTFRRNLITREDIHTAVVALSDTVARRMRKAGVKGMTVQVAIKDTALKVITRQKPAPSPTWLAEDIARVSMELVEHFWPIGKPIRMLTITAMKLIEPGKEAEQLSLFDSPDSDGGPRREELEKAVDQIRDKYGSDSILPGSVLHNDLGIDKGKYN